MRMLFASMLLSGLLLAGCASVPIYRAADGPNDYGYRSTALSDLRYQVRFSSGYRTARETVENLALYRAAQVALSHGGKRFRVVSRHTDKKTSYNRPATSIGFGFGYPYWGTGVSIAHANPRTRYETVLEIQISPDLPSTGADIYNANEIRHHLAALAKNARN